MIPPMRGMRPEDVYALQGVSDPRLSPDGKTVAYAHWSVDEEENEYRANIWLAPVDGSAPPRRFTTGERRDGEPRWSPDGSRMAFVSSRAEKEPGQLYVIPLAGGEAQKLTKLKEDVKSIAWSPDGSQIAFAARVRDESYEEEDDRKRPPKRITRLFYKLDTEGWTSDRRNQLFVVPADGSEEPRQLTEGDFDSAAPAWSPDGSTIAFASARTENWDTELISDVYLVPAAGGEPRRLTHGDGGYGAPVWSPDGKQIVAQFTPDTWVWGKHTQIAVIDVETGEHRLVSESLDRQCGPYPDLRPTAWDGERLVFGVEDGGNVHVYAVPADGSAEPELLLGGTRAVKGFDVQGDTLVHATGTPTTFADLYVGENRVTDATKDFPAGILEPERFTATSKDGTEVEAWLVRPADFEEGKKYPVLLSIHGGPFTQYLASFFDEFQVYAGAGYAVVYANPRGSSGYSEDWGTAIRGPVADGPGWGTVDYEDLMAALDTALERFDFLDAERTGVLGGSYGGFMTSWIVGHTNRFKAACSERAVNNLFTAMGSSDVFWAFKGYFGEFAHDAPEAWLERSPSMYAKNIETPLLILHSDGDLRCSVEQAEHLFIILRLLGKEVEFVRFGRGESHELSRAGSPVHRVQRFEVLIDWFDRYLKR
jgi:dipeptidyl aminopeptidase/acylaminoacyl peptidase